MAHGAGDVQEGCHGDINGPDAHGRYSLTDEFIRGTPIRLADQRRLSLVRLHRLVRLLSSRRPRPQGPRDPDEDLHPQKEAPSSISRAMVDSHPRNHYTYPRGWAGPVSPVPPPPPSSPQHPAAPPPGPFTRRWDGNGGGTGGGRSSKPRRTEDPILIVMTAAS